MIKKKRINWCDKRGKIEKEGMDYWKHIITLFFWYFVPLKISQLNNFNHILKYH